MEDGDKNYETNPGDWSSLKDSNYLDKKPLDKIGMYLNLDDRKIILEAPRNTLLLLLSGAIAETKGKENIKGSATFIPSVNSKELKHIKTFRNVIDKKDNSLAPFADFSNEAVLYSVCGVISGVEYWKDKEEVNNFIELVNNSKSRLAGDPNRENVEKAIDLIIKKLKK